MSLKMNLIYVNTGTGNSLKVALWMKELAEATNVVLMNLGNPAEELKLSDRLGLVTPTHGFTAPWLAIKFAWKLPAGKKREAFCVATRAGMVIKGLQPPGLSGTTCYLLAIILFLATLIIGWVSGFFKWIFKKDKTPFISAGGDIKAGGNITVGNKTFIQKSGKNSENIQGENITTNKYGGDK